MTFADRGVRVLFNMNKNPNNSRYKIIADTLTFQQNCEIIYVVPELNIYL